MSEHFTGMEYLPAPDDLLSVMLLLYLQHHNCKENRTNLLQWTLDLILFLHNPDAFLEREENKIVIEEVRTILKDE